VDVDSQSHDSVFASEALVEPWKLIDMFFMLAIEHEDFMTLCMTWYVAFALDDPTSISPILNLVGLNIIDGALNTIPFSPPT